MQPWHLTFVARGRRTLFSDPVALTRAVRVLGRLGVGRILTFCIVDDHAHVVLNAASRASAGYAGSGLARALMAVGAPQLEPTHVREVEGRAHLESLVAYLVRQPVKHGLREHPATYVGSAAVDLLGARRLPGFEPGLLAAALPRLDVAALVARVCGLPAPPIPSGTLSWSLALAATAVVEEDRDPHALALRAAWCALVAVPDPLPPRTWRRLRTRAVDVQLAETLLRRAALEATVSGSYSSSATFTIRSASAASS